MRRFKTFTNLTHVHSMTECGEISESSIVEGDKMSHQTLQSRRQTLETIPASQDGTRVMFKSLIQRMSNDALLLIRSSLRPGTRFTCHLFAALIIASMSSAYAQHQFPGDIDYTIPQDQYSIPDYSGSLNSQPDRGVGGFGVMGRTGHEAGDTVGRSGSISYMDLAPFSFQGNTMLFGDGRLFVNNHGNMGGSIGLGLRHFFPSKNVVLGSALYYDQDQSRGVTFEQLTIANEILTEFVDFRANVYLPFGSTQQVTGVRFEPGTQTFVDALNGAGAVQGSNIQFQTRTFSSTALEGVDLSLTTPIPGPFAERFNLEATAGGYYYQAQESGLPEISGFKLRLDGDFLDDLTHLSLEVTNDDFFKTNVVFGVDVNYWHHLKKQRRLGKSQYDRMASWVRRSRTVSTLDGSALDAPQLALNPADGNPYLVYHVRNNPNAPLNNFPAPTGNGSESMPFQFIQEGIDGAPFADIVFVHANSVFDGVVDGNANATAVLRDNVLVLGEGVPLTIPVLGFTDEIDLPTVTPGAITRPILQNVTGPVITMADNSRFAGFQILNYADGPAIIVDGINGSELNEIIIDGSTGANGDGIVINNSMGTIVLENITISNTSGNAFEVTGGTAAIAFNGTNSIVNSSGLALFVQDAAGSINMRGTSIMDNGGQGVLITGTTRDATTANITLDQVTLLNTNSTSIGAFQIEEFAGGLTVLDTVMIDTPGNGGIVIDGLSPSASIVFQGAVTVTNRTGVGILISDIDEGINPLVPTTSRSGTVTFQDSVTITGLGAIPSTAAAIDMASSLGTIVFQNITINGSNGVGIDISDLDEIGVTVGSFLVGGLTMVDNTVGNSINIQRNDSTRFQSIFNDISINDRGAFGVEVSTSASIARFIGTTSIDNQQAIFESAIFIEGNTGDVGFNVVDITNALGDINLLGNLDAMGNLTNISPFAGVFVRNNLNPAMNEISEISFASLNIEFEGVPPASAPGSNQLEVAVDFVNNDSVSVGTGIIDAVEARAINVGNNAPPAEPQFHNIQFESISATNENSGILVQNSTGRFIVTGLGGIAGSGGTISGMTNVGADFDDTQIVELSFMDFEANLIGVRGVDMILQGAGLSPMMTLTGVNISDSTQQGIILTDVSDFRLVDSVIDSNGAASGTSQIDILAVTEEADIDLDGNDEAVVYNFAMINNDITDSNTTTGGNMIDIQTGPGIGNGAELNLLFQGNGVPGLAATVNSISSNRNGGAALSVVWEGQSMIVIDNNTFLLTNTTNQTGVALDIDGIADVLFTNNDVASNGFGDTGLDFSFEEATNLVIGSNSVVNDDGNVLPGSGFQMTGINSTGISLTFRAGGNNVNIFDNQINMGGVDSTGIEFNRIFAQSTVAINNNFIGLVTDFDTLAEEGIIFRDVRGIINLNGTQNNSIPLGSFFPFYTDFFIPAGTSTGQIIINGSPRP